MKIFIENGAYDLLNVGDIAMLQVAVDRLTKLFPSASLQIVTRSPDRLPAFCPGSNPLVIFRAQRLYFQSWNILGSVNKVAPEALHEKLLGFEDFLRFNFPKIASNWIQYRLEGRTEGMQVIDEYISAVKDADFVVATGGGYITDVFSQHTKGVLKTLLLAQHFGKPTAFLGQGIGPLSDLTLRKLAGRAFKQAKLIGLREGILSRQILSELDVPSQAVTVTGDDAVELVYQSRATCLGSDIGVNVRISYYSPVQSLEVEILRKVLLEFAKKVRANFRAIPISFSKGADFDSIRTLLGENLLQREAQDKPEASIQAAGLCRIVVTGSYHAGIFALSQGVPVVGLSKSQYYVAKFSGLQKQFEGGVEHVLMDSATFETDLRAALEKVWTSADEVRPRLLEAARRQIDLGTNFYAKLANLVGAVETNEK